MKRIFLNTWLSISPLFACGILMLPISVLAQKGGYNTNENVPVNQDIPSTYYSEDTCTVINLIESYIRPQLRLQLWQNIDTTTYYIYRAMAIAQRVNYTQGIHDLRRCLGSAYTAKGPQDSARYYLRYSIKQMEDKRDTPRINFFLLQYGRSCWLSSKFDSAIYVTEKAAQNALMIHDSSSFLEYVSILPQFYVESGDYVKGALMSSRNMELAKQFNDTFNIVFNARFLAKIYGYMGLHDKALDVAKTALKFGRHSKNIFTNHHANLVISEAYYKKHQYDSAIYYAWQNISLFYGGGQNLSHLTLGAVYTDMGNLDSAGYHIRNFIDATYEYKLHVWPEPFLLLGKCEYNRGNFAEAIKNFHKAENELKPQDKLVFREIYKSLAACYDTLGHPARALHYLDLYIHFEDSMNMSKKSFSIAMIESEKDAEKMKGQIEWLTETNHLQKILTAKEKQQKHMVYGGAGSFILLSLMGFYRFRKHKELKSKQALLKERLRISRDLHDEVGATLSGIAMYSHIAKEQMKSSNNMQAEDSLTMMQKSAGEMVNKLSDIIWLMNPDQDTLLMLIDRLKEYMQQMASARNMQVRIDVTENISEMPIPLEVRRNIYLFCKEAINNAVKYSNGSFIELRVHEIGDDVTFAVIDNGHGFDEITAKRGNGLNNMELRAREIGASFKIWSSPNMGSRLELIYNLLQ